MVPKPPGRNAKPLAVLGEHRFAHEEVVEFQGKVTRNGFYIFLIFFVFEKFFFDETPCSNGSSMFAAHGDAASFGGTFCWPPP